MSSYEIRVVKSEQIITPQGHLLGRHVVHDSRSRSYQISPSAAIASKRWDRKVAVFDQGNVGSCTGNACAGAIGTTPLYESLSEKQKAGIDESLALRIYSAATLLDPWPGAYEPDDTGSDGLSVAKAAVAMSLINGYLHCMSTAAVNTALQSGPVIIGVNWYEGMENPDEQFVIHATGKVLGGHEVCVIGTDIDTRRVEIVNSWGRYWGDEGHCFLSWDDLSKLMSEEGDATVLNAVSSPVPVPVEPTPPTPDNLISLILAWCKQILEALVKLFSGKGQ